MKLIWPGQVPSKETGRSFCFQLYRITAAPGKKSVLLNQYVHQLSCQTEAVGGEVYMALGDVVRIFSPELSQEGADILLCGKNRIKFRPDCRDVNWGEDIMILKHVPFEKRDCLYIPLAEVMERIFEVYTFRMGVYTCICREEEDQNRKFDGISSQPFTERRVDFRLSKSYGDRYFTIWMEKAARLNVYRMYIPFSYDEGRPKKLLVCLHGGTGNSDSVFIRSGQRLQYFAERYGYILLAPNSYVWGSNYGGIIPPVHMFPWTKRDNENEMGIPAFYSSEEIKENALAQEYLEQVLRMVLDDWNIDRSCVFAAGNSMGSVGVFHLLSTWPELFRAGVPTGTMPLTEFLDVQRLGGKPIYFMTGTEDPNDPEDMWIRYQELKEKGVDIRFRVIGGGYHSDAWVQELDTMFQFFETISKE